MRPIKFRAWDVKRKHFIYHNTKGADTFCISLNGRFGYEGISEGGGGIQWRDKDRFILQQFTGLLDKNGKEIYEGDILSYKVGYENKKHDFQGYFVVKWGHWGWRLEGTIPKEDRQICQWPPITMPSGNFEYIEVISNIFESPELLKGGR